VARTYDVDSALLKDYHYLNPEYQEKAGKYIKSLVRLQKAENKVMGQIHQATWRKHAAIDIGGKKLIQCSFCGTPQDELDHLIAGNDVYICDDCSRLCVEILDGIRAEEESRAGK